MYRVTCDNVTLYDTRDEDLVLIDPKVTLELNSPGSFTCKIPPTHPHYNVPQKMLSRVTVYQDSEILFKGRITKDDTDYYNRKELYCEGELAFLNDTVQRPAEYHDLTPREYFAKIVEIHNSQVEADKQFEVGMVTVTNSTDNVYRYTNWESSLKTIKEDLIDDMGGYIRVRNEDGHRYLDYVKDYGVINQQVIEFGENLLDFTRGIDMTDIATVVVPLGNRLEESSIPALEERLTIKSVNGGKDYVVNQDAVKKYGWIVKVVIWDDVTTPERLKSHGEKWLTDEQFENMTIEAKAVDLHYVDDAKQPIRLGDSVRIVSEPHGLDKYFPVTKMAISLNQLSQNTLTFNGTVKASVSTKTNAISQSLKTQIEELPTKNAVVADAIKQATALITAATHGYVTIADDADELFICNDPDYTKATKVWRWNLNGLGYSSTGYKGSYETAITMDGQILGDRIVGNSVDASKLTVDYKTSVTKEIASKAQEAQQNSEEYADNQLKNYYTKGEVQTVIQNTKDSILLSAKETATQYVDNKLEYYATKSEVKITTDGISQTVQKKVGYNDVISAINQSAESIAIKANKIRLEGIVTANGGFSIDTWGNVTAKNGTFSGNIKGSTITGSTINIVDGNGCTIDLNASGLTINANKNTNIFGHQGGILEIGTTKSILDSMFSPITFAEYGYNKLWNVPLADGCNKFRFVWNVMSSSYVEIQTLFGAYGISVWPSDRKFKENIKNSEISGIEEIMKIPHFSYDWKNKNLHVDCGYVAQDMEQCNELYVIRVPQTDNQGKEAGVNLQINEQHIIPVITKALQELIEKVNTLERKVS